jgi:undecaprenyl pyrophosphate phosphatase UppP
MIFQLIGFLTIIVKGLIKNKLQRSFLENPTNVSAIVFAFINIVLILTSLFYKRKEIKAKKIISEMNISVYSPILEKKSRSSTFNILNEFDDLASETEN